MGRQLWTIEEEEEQGGADSRSMEEAEDMQDQVVVPRSQRERVISNVNAKQKETTEKQKKRSDKQNVMLMKKKGTSTKQSERPDKPREGSVRQDMLYQKAALGHAVSRYGRKRKVDEMVWRQTVVDSPLKRRRR